jgi:ABC-type lipoprotein export system ATPase subunit
MVAGTALVSRDGRAVGTSEIHPPPHILAMPAAEAIHLVKEYPEAAGRPPRRVLDDVSLAVEAGESLAIVGPSGCGKSTLLNLIGLLDEPTSGEVRLAGRSVAGLGEPARAVLRAELIGFVFQLHHLLPQCTVLENVLVPTLALPPGHEARAGAPARAEALLDRVGLSAQRSVFPGVLSGGERQRVAVVRALINQPKLILADEPTGALDRDNAARVVDLLRSLATEHEAGLIMVTHDQALAASLQKTLTLA